MLNLQLLACASTHMCDGGYAGGGVNAAFQTPLCRPGSAATFSLAASISKSYVCFSPARVWTASLLTAQKRYVLKLTQNSGERLNAFWSQCG